MARLPIPGSDDNAWGSIMNDFLGVSLNPDGTLQLSTAIEGMNVSGPINYMDNNGVVRAQSDSVSGDFWFLSNAVWNPTAGTQNPPGEFYRIDPGHVAFGLQLQGQGFIPGEPDLGYYVPGATIWVAEATGPPGGNLGGYTLIRGGGAANGNRFGAVGGWELGITVTGERQLTVGGGGIEIDGYGTIPYGRVVNNTTGTLLHRRMVGMAQNGYTDFGGFDIPAKESWYWGYLEDYNPAAGGPPYPEVPNSSRWAVAWIPPNQNLANPVFNEYLKVYPDGHIEVYQDPTTSLGIATKEYVDNAAAGTVGLRGGEAFFTGNGTQTTFFQPHGMAATPSRVLLTPMNAVSVGCWYTKDSTEIGINYATAPANGATIGVAWSAYP